MTRSSLAVTWVVSVLLAAVFGWFAGIQNAARVATASAHFMMYLFVFAIIAMAGGAAWFALRGHHDMDDHLTRPNGRY